MTDPHGGGCIASQVGGADIFGLDILGLHRSSFEARVFARRYAVGRRVQRSLFFCRVCFDSVGGRVRLGQRASRHHAPPGHCQNSRFSQP